MSVHHAGGQSAISTAREVLASLISAGIRDLVISPGSRSAPLAYAVAEAEAADKLAVHVRIDERSAAFMALGLSQSTGVPAAVAATSGSAIGQMLPAVMEANHTGTPLLVLSADRPDELHGTGASQTTVQKELFGSHVRVALNVEAGAPAAHTVADALKGLRGTAAHPAGPVQLNLQFRDPLTPEDDSRIDQQTWTEVTAGTWVEHIEQRQWHQASGLSEHRTVVVAGHGAGQEAQYFAQSHGLPLFAEPSSNARFSANAIGHYRPLIAVGQKQIERIVLFGRPTLSRPVARLLADPRIDSVIWEPAPAPWYEAGRRRETPINSAEALSQFAGRPPAGWLEAWQGLDRQAASVRAAQDQVQELNGASVAQVLWEASLPQLLIGSSNIVRDFDLAACPQASGPARVFANRGLAGIDGTISTAMGLALGTGQHTVAVMGDITFAHDAGSMIWTRGEAQPNLDVVVYNDAGGAIFSTLEHGAVHESGRYDHAVDRLFGTEQEMNLSALAEGYGWEYHRVTQVQELAQLMSQRTGASLRLIEVPARRDELRAQNIELAQSIGTLPWPLAKAV